MVGLVFVAHSRLLAEALLGLVRQVATQDVPIALAAGVGSDCNEFGTDATNILAAIQSVYSPDGVLILMDLGSAVLSAETALDLLPEEQRHNIRLCAAPLVEGAIVAAVQAGLGNDLNAVNDEAFKALAPKIEHLEVSQVERPAFSQAAPLTSGQRYGAQAARSRQAAPLTSGQQFIAQATQPQLVGTAPNEASGFQSVILTLQNLHGLHARPAARFVQAASRFDAEIRVTNLTGKKGPVSAKSINRLATLGAVKGHQVKIEARGRQATQALERLSQLVIDNFGEVEEAQDIVEKAAVIRPDIVLKPDSAIQGIPISEGVALGPLYLYKPSPPPIPDYVPQEPQTEWERLQRALDETCRVIQQRQASLRGLLGEAQTTIFDAHRLILQDPDLLENVHKRIFENNSNAALAWSESISGLADSYNALEDVYQKTRRADLLDVGNQVLLALADRSQVAKVELPKPVILFVQELTPNEAAQFDLQQVLGVVTASGGPTSHSAILVRSLGLPAISGVDLGALNLKPDTLVGLDGSQGLLWIEPGKEIQKQWAASRAAWLAKRQRLLSTSHEPARTRDGRLFEVAANVGGLLDAQAAALNGADGIGVLRTEFLYLRRTTPPSEEEQIQTLLDIASRISNLPIIVRTLDVGGDKPLPYINLPPEVNPFLGMRALRISFKQPELFLPQLRAILRAGWHHDIAVMFPMVATLEEILQAKDWLAQAHRALEKEKTSHRWPIKTGIMVEIPSAALLSSSLAPQVDFFSVGTNDLTQYTLAAERGNPDLAAYSDALHPAVLRLVKLVVDAAHQFGKWVGVCGEIAGDRLAIPVLLGLGVDELSLNPADIPQVKSTIRALEMSAIRELAERCLQRESAQAVRNLTNAYYEGRDSNNKLPHEVKSC